jgi:hypothetical protein
MKVPPFTLVHHRHTKAYRNTDDAFAPPLLLNAIRGVKSELADTLLHLKPQLRETLLISAISRGTTSPAGIPSAVPILERTVRELERQPKVVTVGIWDLGARVGLLPRVIETLNQAQPAFTFFDVQAAIPAGMISRPERVVAWAQERLGKKLPKAE